MKILSYLFASIVCLVMAGCYYPPPPPPPKPVHPPHKTIVCRTNAYGKRVCTEIIKVPARGV